MNLAQEKNQKQILVVEDEKPISKALQLKLTHEGYIVDVAFNGDEAIEKIQNQNFDLILLDIVMPVRDGFGVLEGLKQSGKTIPVIITSNLSQPEDIKRAKELGATDFVVKSDTPLADIVKLVNNVLG